LDCNDVRMGFLANGHIPRCTRVVRSKVTCCQTAGRIAGVRAPKVRIVKSGPGADVAGGRGCIATEAIAAGEHVVEVNMSNTIQVAVEEPNETDPWFVRLALEVLREHALGESSAVGGYVAALSKVRDGESSILFDDIALSQICWYSALHHDVEEYREYIRDAFNRHKNTVQMNEESWKWALWIAHSRAFAIPPDGHYVALIPMVDMFNHAVRASSELVLDETKTQLCIVFDDDVPADSEIFITYGGLSNDVLLPYFGFVEEDNPVDTYTFRGLDPLFSGLLDLFQQPERRASLEQLGYEDISGTSFVFTRDKPSPDALTVMRVLLAENLSALEPQKLREASDLQTELQVWSTTEKALQSEIERISARTAHSTAEADWSRAFAQEKIRTLSDSVRILQWWKNVSLRVGRVTTVMVPPGKQVIPIQMARRY